MQRGSNGINDVYEEAMRQRHRGSAVGFLKGLTYAIVRKTDGQREGKASPSKKL